MPIEVSKITLPSDFDYLEGDVIALDRGDAEAVGGAPLGHADGVGVVGREITDGAVELVADAVAAAAGYALGDWPHLGGGQRFAALLGMRQRFETLVAFGDAAHFAVAISVAVSVAVVRRTAFQHIP